MTPQFCANEPFSHGRQLRETLLSTRVPHRKPKASFVADLNTERGSSCDVGADTALNSWRPWSGSCDQAVTGWGGGGRAVVEIKYLTRARSLTLLSVHTFNKISCHIDPFKMCRLTDERSHNGGKKWFCVMT